MIELFKVGPGHVGELGALQLDDRTVDRRQQLQALGGDLDKDDAAILLDPIPRDQAKLFKPVDEPGDIGDAGDQFVADLAAGPARSAVTPQDAEDVVGCFREAVSLEKFRERRRELGGGADHVEEHLLFKEVKRLLLAYFVLQRFQTGFSEVGRVIVVKTIFV